MDGTVRAVGTLTAARVERVLAAAAAAPSLHNSQPWRFTLGAQAIEVRADLSRALPAADPDHREMWLAGGAAVLNLTLAIRSAGLAAEVSLQPRATDPELLARVTPGRPSMATPEEARLAAAIFHRHTSRRPMVTTDIPDGLTEQMRRAARSESCWLAPLSVAQAYALQRLVVSAHRTQQADPAYRAEWAAWTARPPGSPDGVPAASGGPLPELWDRLMVRDFSGGTAAPRPRGKEYEPDPAIVVIGSFHDLPLAWLQAGRAMQRVLLTATDGGLATSFISQVVEVRAARQALHELIGGALWPQVVLRLGYSSPATPTPRRPVTELVDAEQAPAR